WGIIKHTWKWIMAQNSYDNFESVVDYNTVLDVFEGPLDLLLHLINVAQIRIEDVFVSKVTEQFLDYVDFMKEQQSRDMDKESEYLAIAAQIIYIKSKSLVPAPVEGPEEPGPDQDELDFIEQLKQRELELIKEKEPKLKELETVGYVYKDPDPSIKGERIVYKDFTVEGLLDAFAKLMLRNESMMREKNDVKEIPKEQYTVWEKVIFIRDTLKDAPEHKTDFENLFPTSTKSEMVTTFQAMLEMLKLQYIMVEQPEIFGKITVKVNPEWNMEDVSSGELDEYN
ncbi:MAG: segregation/condensation protein A, partial [Clostridia bacterium]|nr:segregation/condensation protein A [Clostridia bacterium]